MINIVTVNWNSYDFLYLLIESLQKYTSCEYKLIVIDNSLKKQSISFTNVHHMPLDRNIGHGAGLNLGVSKCQEISPNYPYTMFLDVDCHFICRNWDTLATGMLETYDIVGGKGVPQKPIRPACMIMKKEWSNYDWKDTPGYKGCRVTPDGYDVAILAYHHILKDGGKIGFFKSKENRYNTLNGEEWCVGETPICYHHWHGSHLKERSVDFPHNDLFSDKANLFQQIPWRIL